MTRYGVLVIAVAVLCVSGRPLGMEVAQDPLTLKEQNAAILEELRSIRRLLETRPAPQAPSLQRVVLHRLGDYVLGRQDAPLTMVEFVDIECPYCRQFALKTFDRLKTEWIDAGTLRYASFDYPLDLHPTARLAARAVRCAGKQGKYWDFRKLLRRNSTTLSEGRIRTNAASLGMNLGLLDKCVQEGTIDGAIDADMEEGSRIGITGTPTLSSGEVRPMAWKGQLS